MRLLANINIVLLLTLSSCAAQYETIRNKTGAEISGPDTKNDEDQTVNSKGPVANIEVIFEGKAVTAVPLGANFTVRPTDDTRDPDAKPQEDCRNVGITTATYDLEDKDTVEVKRAEECSPLATNSSYDTLGEYEITITVSDQTAKTAKATMTLTVFDDINGNGELDENEVLPDNASFRITASPIIAQLNESITFTGFCQRVDNMTISWDFKDGSQAQGQTQTHSYSATGSYLVKATCSGDDNKNLRASLTIIVGNGDVDQGEKTTPDPVDDPPKTSIEEDNGSISSNPAQGPDQK